MEESIKDYNKNMPASIILADAMGRYNAYNYCMHQIDSLAYQTASGLSHDLRQLRAQIEARWMAAADDVQMIAADLETDLDAENLIEMETKDYE